MANRYIGSYLPKLTTMLCLWMVVECAHASEALVEFNRLDQLADEFFIFSNLKHAPPLQFENDGIGDTGAVGRNSSHTGPTCALYTEKTFDITEEGSTLNLSAYVRFDEFRQKTGTVTLELIVFSDMNITNSAHFRVGLSVGEDFKIAGIRGMCGFGHGGSGGPNFRPFPDEPLEADHWYRFSADFSFMQSGHVKTSVSLDDFGKDGHSLQQNIFERTDEPFSLRQRSYPDSYAAILSATEAYAGFSLMGNWTMSVMDNFSAHIEP